MGINFPNTPTTGQTFTVGGVTYKWNGHSWDATSVNPATITSETPPPGPINGQLWWESDSGQMYIWFDDGNSAQWVQVVGGIAGSGGSGGGAAVTVTDDKAPTGPVDGQLWWKSDNGVLYIYYDDGNSKQWVQAAAPPVAANPGPTTDLDMLGYNIINVGPNKQPVQVRTARAKNRVNNPTAQVSQENGSTAVAAAGGYPADQWMTTFSGIVGQGQRTINAAIPTPEGTTSYVSLGATTAKGSLAAGDFLQAYLPIEGLDVADLLWGTVAAKPVILRFAAQHDAPGTYAFSIGNSSRCYCGTFTITTAGVWQVFTFAIPGDTTGTWPVDSSLWATVRFCQAAGSTYVGAAGWQAGGKFAPPGCSNGAAVANSFLRITDVGLHADPDNTGIAPPFNAPPYEDDLARCMRYWELLPMLLTGVGNGSSLFEYRAPLKVVKRTSPTTSGTVGGTNVTGGGSSADVNSVKMSATTTGTGITVCSMGGAIAANARMI